MENTNKRTLNGIDIVEGKVHSTEDMVKWFTLFATRLRYEVKRTGGTSMQNVYNAYLYANSNTQIDC